MKKIIKKIVPKKILNLKHLFFAWHSAVKYKHPSEEMLVIGITGTSGKSTTVYILRQILETAGYTVGSLSTIDFYIAGKDKLNDQKMTMLGKYFIQKNLREMAKQKCDIVIVETTSEGVVQHRHRFINYDVAVLTNLYPEHIESHGGFENYKNAKRSFFKYVAGCKKKNIKNAIEKTEVVNANIAESSEFVLNDFVRKFAFARKSQTDFLKDEKLDEKFFLDDLKISKNGLSFEINGDEFSSSLFGEHNAMNILTAVSVAKALGVDLKIIQKAVRNLKDIPGRLEFIKEAEKFGFKVIVDYAFEPVALGSLYKVAKLLEPEKIIHICGSAGGGRDKSRRKPIGKIVGENADVCIVTNEDPYDEDPMEIIRDVSVGAKEAGKKLNENLFEISDRKKAIEKALEMAGKGDLVLITGKGSEQAIVQNGKLLPWDDRKAVREGIKSVKSIK